MKALGIDLGTTSICGVLIDAQTGKMLKSVTKANTALLQTNRPFERTQNPSVIVSIAREIVEQLCSEETEVGVIGITGQMHGIVYVDKDGQAVSPLYTWQDESGTQVGKRGICHADALTGKTGYTLYPGYGCVTYYSHLIEKRVPQTACGICTIGDYFAMQLTNTKHPVIHSSNAESLGCYKREEKSFDLAALSEAGMDKAFFPQVESGYRVVGKTPNGIQVSCAIGDNQGSFLGAVKDMEHSVLINVGTGSQISVLAAKDVAQVSKSIDIRPCIGEQNLLVGASLCGGRAYAMLKQFFQSVIDMSGLKTEGQLYAQMEEVGFSAFKEENHLSVSTKFCGTRQSPKERGSISNIGLLNLSAGSLTVGVLVGIASELFELYRKTQGKTFGEPTILVGSGNGIRKNKLLQKIFEDLFNMPMQIPQYNEEAAYGAALYSLVCVGEVETMKQAQRGITYLHRNEYRYPTRK